MNVTSWFLGSCTQDTSNGHCAPAHDFTLPVQDTGAGDDLGSAVDSGSAIDSGSVVGSGSVVTSGSAVPLALLLPGV